MKIKYRYVPQSKDKSHFLDAHSQPVTDFMKAIRFADPDDDYAIWLLGRYGPKEPQNYEPVLMKITYELEDVNHDDSQSATQSN